MARIHSDMTALVGRTPLVRLNRITEGCRATVLAKLEFMNPLSSIKDRTGLAMIEAAEREGRLKPGSVIVEHEFGLTEPVVNLPTREGDDPHGAPRRDPVALEQVTHFFNTGEFIHTCDGICDPN